MEYNEAIQPLDLIRSADDFGDALAIAKACDLKEPPLLVESDHSFTFHTGLQETSAHALLISSDIGSIRTRALIATLTSLDAGAVLPLKPGVDDELIALRDEVWRLSQMRGDYQGLVNDAGDHLAGLVGLILGAAKRNVAAIIDGVDAFAAALLAQRLAYRSTERLLAASVSPDPAIDQASSRLRIPVVLATSVPKNAALVAFRHLEATLALTR